MFERRLVAYSGLFKLACVQCVPRSEENDSLTSCPGRASLCARPEPLASATAVSHSAGEDAVASLIPERHGVTGHFSHAVS